MHKNYKQLMVLSLAAMGVLAAGCGETKYSDEEFKDYCNAKSGFQWNEITRTCDIDLKEKCTESVCKNSNTLNQCNVADGISTEIPCPNGCAQDENKCKETPALDKCTKDECKDENILLKCNSDGTTSEEECANGCENGACKEEPLGQCTDEEQRCSDDNSYIEVCNSGIWTEKEKCLYGCDVDNNACFKPVVEDCTDSEKDLFRCINSNTLQICNGNHWDTVLSEDEKSQCASCKIGTPTGSIADVCEAPTQEPCEGSEYRCIDDNTLQQCNGSYWEIVTQEDEKSQCASCKIGASTGSIADVCEAPTLEPCEGSVYRCIDDNTLQQCNGSYWEIVTQEDEKSQCASCKIGTPTGSIADVCEAPTQEPCEGSEYRCIDDNTLQQCNGSYWEIVTQEDEKSQCASCKIGAPTGSIADVCEAPTLEPCEGSVYRCIDDNTLQQCNGSYWEIVTQEDEKSQCASCKIGAPIGPIADVCEAPTLEPCEGSVYRCIDDNTLQQCNGSYWEIVTQEDEKSQCASCKIGAPAGLIADVCEAPTQEPCEGSEYRCIDDNTLQQCNGNNWVMSPITEQSQCKSCRAISSSGTDSIKGSEIEEVCNICEVGEKKCESSDGNVLYLTCVEGLWFPEKCSTNVSGARVECDNDKGCLQKCNDTNKVICNNECVDLQSNQDHCGQCNRNCSAYCKNGTCVECVSDTDCSDPENNYCDGATCISKKKIGEECGTEEKCKMICISNKGALNDGKYVCACTGNSSGYFMCEGNQFYCNDAGLCVTNLLGGHDCSNANQCLSQHCVENKCKCSNSVDCISGFVCDVMNPCNSSAPNECIGDCVNKDNLYDHGHSCENNDVCNSHWCIDNKCGCSNESDCSDSSGEQKICRKGVCTESCSGLNGQYRYYTEKNEVQQCQNGVWVTDRLANLYKEKSCQSQLSSATNPCRLEFEYISGSNTYSYWFYCHNITGSGCVDDMCIDNNVNVSLECKNQLVGSGGASPSTASAADSCFVFDNKAFEVSITNNSPSIYNVNKCESGCNSNFTGCHINSYDDNTCKENVIDMKLFSYGDGMFAHGGSIDGMQIQTNSTSYDLCFKEKNIGLSSCKYFSNIEEYVLCNRMDNYITSTDYTICIDVFDANYEKKSFKFDGQNVDGKLKGTYCPKGCNVNYNGCEGDFIPSP